MELLITKNDFGNTEIVSDDGSTRYVVKTQSKLLGSPKTEISKVERHQIDGRLQELTSSIATIRWNVGKPVVIDTDNERISKQAWMRGQPQHSTRKWTASDREEYEWSIENPIQLRDMYPLPITVAYYTPGSLLRRRKSKLVVESQVFHIMDSIVAAFVFIAMEWQNKPPMTG